MYRPIATIVACVSFAGVAIADSFREQLEALRVEHRVPGIAVRVMIGDKVIKDQVAGTLSQSSEELITPGDAWHLGSDTKAMTATLAARLVERGTIGWDTTLVQAIPELKDRIDPAWHNVTLRHLLQHRSGFDPSRETPTWLNAMHNADADGVPLHSQRVDAIAQLLKDAPSKPIDASNFSYSNGNYIAAGAMLEAATGNDWEALMRGELFELLKMTSAGFGPPDRIMGHVERLSVLVPVMMDNPRALGPAGTVHANLEDWAKFAAIHSGIVTGYLKPETLKTLQTPPEDGNYAMGWGVQGSLLTHDGSNTTCFARILIRQPIHEIILITLNVANPKACDAATALAIRVLEDAQKKVK